MERKRANLAVQISVSAYSLTAFCEYLLAWFVTPFCVTVSGCGVECTVLPEIGQLDGVETGRTMG